MLRTLSVNKWFWFSVGATEVPSLEYVTYAFLHISKTTLPLPDQKKISPQNNIWPLKSNICGRIRLLLLHRKYLAVSILPKSEFLHNIWRLFSAKKRVGPSECRSLKRLFAEAQMKTKGWLGPLQNRPYINKDPPKFYKWKTFLMIEYNPRNMWKYNDQD